MLAGVIMLITLPSFSRILNIPVLVSVAGILILALSAGLTNPRLQWVAWANVIVSSIGFLIFETYGILAYNQGTQGAISRIGENFVIINIMLGLMFLISLYFSVRTLRGFYLKEIGNEQ
jgi:hypothetical protein